MLPSNFRLKNGAKYIFHVKNTKYIAMKYYNLHERRHILTKSIDLFLIYLTQTQVALAAAPRILFQPYAHCTLSSPPSYLSLVAQSHLSPLLSV